MGGPVMSVYGERMARVEVQVEELKKAFNEHKEETAKQFSEINEKLDDLLILRYKGAGAFWLAATLVGTGIVGAVAQVFQWFKG
jgi:hypothetical protein